MSPLQINIYLKYMMIMYKNKFYINSLNCSVEITSKTLNLNNLKKDIEKNQLLYRFIPNFDFAKTVKIAFLSIENNTKKNFSFSIQGSLLQGDYGTDFSSTDVIVLTEYLLERLRQESDIYTIHASSVYKKDRGVLLIGNLTGTGKTSTALYLQKKLKFSIYSDEKTLVNANKKILVGQIEKIFLEDKTIKCLNSANINLQEEVLISKTSNKTLSLIIIPQVILGLSSPVIKHYSKPQLKWILYEGFSKDIRLVNGMVFDMTIPIIPLDTQQIAQKRLDDTIVLSEKIPCYLIQGSLSQIGEEINKII